MKRFHFIIKWVASLTEDKTSYDFKSIIIIEAENVTDAMEKLLKWSKDEKITIVDYVQMDQPFYIE